MYKNKSRYPAKRTQQRFAFKCVVILNIFFASPAMLIAQDDLFGLTGNYTYPELEPEPEPEPEPELPLKCFVLDDTDPKVTHVEVTCEEMNAISREKNSCYVRQRRGHQIIHTEISCGG